jgi:hypothetical protein
MMNSKSIISRREILELCLEKLNEKQLPDLLGNLLSPKERDDLKDRENKAEILSDLERWGGHYISQLVQELSRARWADILGKDLVERLNNLLEILDKNTRPPVIFVNRVDEINLAFRSTLLNQYWIIDGPVGYGKSMFLDEVEGRYKREGWICCHVKISRDNPLTITSIANDFASKLDSDLRFDKRMIMDKIGKRIASCVLECNVKSNGNSERLLNARYLGVAFFIDNVDVLPKDSVEELVEFINGVYEGLNNAGFFRNQNRLRFFLAGRNIISRFTLLRGRIDRILSPFKFQDVQQTVREYALRANVVLTENTSDHIAAQLMYITGGHPGAMSIILNELAQNKFVDGPKVLEEELDSYLIKAIYPLFDQLEIDFVDMGHLLKVLESISVFRRLDLTILGKLIERKTVKWDASRDELEDALLNAQLTQRAGGFLQDDITRRLFSIRLRKKDNARFNQLCQEAFSIYNDYFGSPKHRKPEIVSIEFLYHKLLAGYYVEGLRETQLMNSMLEQVNLIFDELTITWDFREIIPEILDLLRRDWEFEFTMNYLMREDGYNHTTYSQLIEFAEQIYQQKQENAK